MAKRLPKYIAWEDKQGYPLPAKGDWIKITCDPYDPDSEYKGKYVMLARAESDPGPRQVVTAVADGAIAAVAAEKYLEE